MQKIYNIGLIPHRKDLTERAMLPFSQVNYLINGACLDRVTLITSATDSGKAQPLYSKIQTPYGEKRIGDIGVGDIVCGMNGKSQTVLGVFPQGEKEIYRVYTADNTYTDCVGEHLWTVIDTICNNKIKTITTKEIIKGIENNHKKGFRYALPKYQPIEYSEKNFFCDSYVLGVYLGNGCSSEKQFSISSNDIEVIEKVSKKINATYYRRSIHNYTYCFKINNEKDRTRESNKYHLTKNIIPPELLGLKSSQKYIPQEYFYGSVEQRLELLRGLMDTDGCVSNAKNRHSINTTYSTTSERLAKDVCKLVLSLGFVANYTTSKRHNRECNTEYVVNVRIDKNINPFSLSRKANAWRPATIFKYRKIARIEKLNKKEECICIYVSNQDHLYLTDNYIVTHNTTITSQIICDIIKQGYKCCCFFGEDTAYESQDRIFKQSLKADESGGIYYQPYIVNGKETNCGEYILDDETWQKAYERFNDKLFLYNTKASARVEDILDGFEEARTKYGCRIFVLDNCEQFDFATDNENIELKNSVIKIRDYAINNKVHIFLVHHIRKMPRDVILPDMNDIKGTGSLVNIAKNVIIIVRMDKVDHSTKEYKSLKSLLELNNYNLDEADCLVHVAKTKGRKIGFACLKFNKKLGIYYDCKKIDENKEESEKAQVIAPKQQSTFDQPFDPMRPDLTPISGDSLPF